MWTNGLDLYCCLATYKTNNCCAKAKCWSLDTEFPLFPNKGISVGECKQWPVTMGISVYVPFGDVPGKACCNVVNRPGSAFIGQNAKKTANFFHRITSTMVHYIEAFSKMVVHMADEYFTFFYHHYIILSLWINRHAINVDSFSF